MGVFFDNSITDVGRQLWAEMQAGGSFMPTKIVIGSGYMPTGKTSRTMTAVAEPVQNISLNKTEKLTDGDYVFGGVFTNKDVTTPFYYRELALYAKVKRADGTETAETLYSYGNAGYNAELIPAYSTGTAIERQLDIISYIGNDATVMVEIQSGVTVSQQEFNAKIAELTAADEAFGKELKKHIDDTDIHITSNERNTWNNKVDKAEGKGLSSNDYSNTDKDKVKNLPKDTNLALGKKVDKEAGKTLSSNDYSNEDKNKLGTLNTVSIKNENISITASSWAIDSENTFEDYPYKVTVPISGIDDSWYLKLITPDHTNRDLDSFFCQFFNTVEGGVEIWGESLPTSDIVIENMVFEKVI